MFRARLALVGAVVGLIAACGGGNTGPTPPPPPPPPPTPASLAKQGGDNQTAEPGQAVSVAPSVKVTSSTGAVVSGVTVTFAVASGGGSITGATPTTGSDGVATVGSWVLGTAGTNTLTASIVGPGVTGNPATFTANAQLASFNPTSNTTLTGTRSYASMTIPSGVTVTVTGSLVINVSGPVAIAGTLTGDCTSMEVRATGSLTVDGLVRNSCTVAPSGTAPGIKLVAGGGWTIGTTVSSQDAVVSDGSIRITDPATENLDFSPLPIAGAAPEAPFSDFTGPFSPQNVSPPSAINRPVRAGKGSSNNPSTDGPLTINGEVTAGNGKDAVAKSQGGACDNSTALGGNGGTVIAVARNALLTLKAGSVVRGGDGGKGGSCTSTSGCPSSAIGGAGGNGGSVLLGGSSIVFEANVNVIRGNGGEGGDANTKGDDGAACTNGCAATSNAGKGGNAGGIGYAVLSPGTITGAPTEAGGDGGPGGRADATAGKGGDCATCPAGKGGDGGVANSTGGDGGNGAASNIWAIAPGSHHKGFGGTSNAVGGNGGKGASCCTPTAQQGGAGGKGGNAISNAGQIGAQGINAGGRGNNTGNAGNGGNGGDGNGPGAGGAKGTGLGILNPIPDGTDGAPGQACPGLSCTVTPASQNVVQGGSGSVNVTIVRQGSVTGVVTGQLKDDLGNVLSNFTIPSGSNSATVPFTLPSPRAPGGPFTFTVTVTGPGGTPVTTATFQVTITPSGGGLLIRFCNYNVGRTMIWGAYTFDFQSWIQSSVQTNAQGQYAEYIAPSAGALISGAYVTDFGNNTYATTYYKGTATELQTFGNNSCAPNFPVGGNTVAGNITGLLGTERSWATLGFQTHTSVANGSFNWTSIPNGTFNVFASAFNGSTGTPRTFKLQRNVQIPTSGPIQVDLTTGDAPVTFTGVFTNVTQGDVFTTETGILMPPASGGFNGFTQGTAAGSSVTRSLPFVPANLIQTGDFHLVFASDQATSGATRSYITYTNTASNMTVNLWGGITGVTDVCAASAPPFRMLVDATVPSQYQDYFEIEHHQTLSNGARSVFGYASPTYTGGGNINWATPGFTGANYNPTWGLQGGSPITGSISAFGSNVAGGSLLTQPQNGLQLYSADFPLPSVTCNGSTAQPQLVEMLINFPGVQQGVVPSPATYPENLAEVINGNPANTVGTMNLLTVGPNGNNFVGQSPTRIGAGPGNSFIDDLSSIIVNGAVFPVGRVHFIVLNSNASASNPLTVEWLNKDDQVIKTDVVTGNGQVSLRRPLGGKKVRYKGLATGFWDMQKKQYSKDH